MKVLLFAGTTEGRQLAEFMTAKEIQLQVCVTTEYGKDLLLKANPCKNSSLMQVSDIPLTQADMEVLMRQQVFDFVIDATHPYAVEASENIKRACLETGLTYIRLLRENVAEEGIETDRAIENNRRVDRIEVDHVSEAVEFLRKTTGNILITTGSKELQAFGSLPDYQERCYARVLSTAVVMTECEKLGFAGKHLFCMQGPFSEEMNIAILKQTEAKYLVTKEAGKTGGFAEKISAANHLGVTAIVIKRPKESGLSYEEVCDYIERRLKQDDQECAREIHIVGIGPGSIDEMTMSAYRAITTSQVLIGAERMLLVAKKCIEEAVHQGSAVEMNRTYISEYRAEEITEYLFEQGNGERADQISVLFSGDVGFYSGAVKLEKLLSEQIQQRKITCQIEIHPGIASPIYLCSRLGIAWEDVKLLSLHGRNENVAAAIQKNRYVFLLLGGKTDLQKLVQQLEKMQELNQFKLYIGENLSYDDERITCETVQECRHRLISDKSDDQNSRHLISILIENVCNRNHMVSSGIRDEEWIRGKVPMTKSECRAIILSKFQLTNDAVIYDIGAGTGSVSIEAAKLAEQGMVYAIEQKEEAISLINQNQQLFNVWNLQCVHGSAPEAFLELPIPTHAFIGGSSGHLQEIVECLLQKNPQIRIVISAITLETEQIASVLLKKYQPRNAEIVRLALTRSKQIGDYHMMSPENPITIISFTGVGENHE